MQLLEVKESSAFVRWPEIAGIGEASTWLQLQVDLGLSPLTVDAG